MTVYDHAMIPGNDWAEMQSADRLHLHVSLIGTCLPPSLGISLLPKAGLVPSALPRGLLCHWGPSDVMVPQTCPDCLSEHAGFSSWKLIVFTVFDA